MTDGWAADEVTEVAGGKIYAAVRGVVGRPTVVCVHGLGASHRYFRRLAAALGPDVLVAAPDLPGFGESPGSRRALDVPGLADALGGWLELTGRAGASLVANSLGCQVAVDLAARRPELVGPMVLVGPTVDPRARSALRQATRLVADLPFERPALVPLVLGDWLRCGPRRFSATVAAMLADHVEVKLPRVRTRVLVVRGARDPVVPRRWAEEVAHALPLGRLHEVTGAGHAAHWSAPAEVGALVRSVLPPTDAPRT